MRLQKRSLLGLPILAVFLAAAYAFWLEPYWLKVSRINIDLPPHVRPARDVKILHLSDFHPLGKVYERKILQWAHEENPDLIVLTGDFVEEAGMMDHVLDFVSRLPNVKTYAVLGNWEHWAKIDVKEYRQKLKDRSITLLVNEGETVTLAGQDFVISGVDDPGTWYDDIQKTLKRSPAGYRILLSHSPWIMKKPEISQFSLVLAGHCHGGQVRLPFYGPVWLPRGCARDNYYGLYHYPATTLYVTAGLGTSILPIRFLSRPEMAVILLSPVRKSVSLG
jgi:predicted MPP superfamily phosphohydrolase